MNLEERKEFYDSLIEIGLRYYPHDHIELEADDDGEGIWINVRGHRIWRFERPKESE